MCVYVSLQFERIVAAGRTFTKVELNESIRYAPGDPVEFWLNGLLCLDVTNAIPILSRLVWLSYKVELICYHPISPDVCPINRLPLPDKCDLYYVNRDTLFSYHKDSEIFLQVPLSVNTVEILLCC